MAPTTPRPEITSYLADRRGFHKLILERVYEPAIPELRRSEEVTSTRADLLAGMDARTALELVNEVLPSIAILDPAVAPAHFGGRAGRGRAYQCVLRRGGPCQDWV